MILSSGLLRGMYQVCRSYPSRNALRRAQCRWGTSSAHPVWHHTWLWRFNVFGLSGLFFAFILWKPSPTPCKFSISDSCPTSGVSHVSIPSVCIPGSRKCKVDTWWQKNMHHTKVFNTSKRKTSLNSLRLAHHLTKGLSKMSFPFFLQESGWKPFLKNLPQRSQDLSGRTSAAVSPCRHGDVWKTQRQHRDIPVPVIILPDIGKALGQNLGDLKNGNNDVQMIWYNDVLHFIILIFNSFIDACYCNYELFIVSLDWGNGWSLQVCETRIRCKAISPVSLCIKVADGFRSQAMWIMFAKGTLPPKKGCEKSRVFETHPNSISQSVQTFHAFRPSLDGPLCIRQFYLLCSTFQWSSCDEKCFSFNKFLSAKKTSFPRL